MANSIIARVSSTCSRGHRETKSLKRTSVRLGISTNYFEPIFWKEPTTIMRLALPFLMAEEEANPIIMVWELTDNTPNWRGFGTPISG